MISLTKQSFIHAVCATALLAGLASGAVIYDSGVSALTLSDPTELARLSRNGITSDWSAPKTFPGAITAAPGNPFHYMTYLVPDVAYPFIQISFDDLSGTALTFASAYLGAYTPNGTPPSFGLDTNYLGDAGASGNFFGVNPRAFQVTVPIGDDLVIAINDTSSTGSGSVGAPYRVLIEGFFDTNFNDTPEPASLALCGFGLLCAVLLCLRHRRSRSAS
jgi:hypothetical protein